MNRNSIRIHQKPRGREQYRCRYTAIVSTLLIWAVTAARLLAVEPNPEKKLTVEVTQGQGVDHDITAPRESAITLRVSDEALKPVVGAVVVLQLPLGGPGGIFLNGSRFQTILTDANGQASVQGFRHNSVPGEFSIVATISYRDYQSVTMNIEQKNVAPQAQPGEPAPVQTTKRDSRRLIALVAIIGGAAAGAALGLAGGGGSGSPSTPSTPPTGGPPTTINPGNPNFGPPR
jgi:hypothetical protein